MSYTVIYEKPYPVSPYMTMHTDKSAYKSGDTGDILKNLMTKIKKTMTHYLLTNGNSDTAR